MIKLFYRSFGRATPTAAGGSPGISMWLLACGHVLSSALMLLFLNFFSLMAGVRILPAQGGGVRFTFIHLFGRFPLIGIALPVLLGCAVWRNLELANAATIVLVPLATVALAIVLMGLAMVGNLVRGRRGGGAPTV